MTETIYGKFSTSNQADAAVSELEESGINESSIIYDKVGLVVTVRVDIDHAIAVRTTIERHGGKTEVDNIPDEGTIPEDPLEYSD